MTTSTTQYQYQTGTDCWGILYLIGDEYLDQTSSESSLDADEVSSVSPLVIEEASNGYQIKGKVSDNLVDVSVAKVSKGIDLSPPLEQEQQLLEELRKVFGINISRKLVTFKYGIERGALGEGDRVIFKRKSSHTGGELVTTSKGLGIRCEYCQSEHGSFSSFIRHLRSNDLPRLQIVLHKSKETLSWSMFRQRVLDANVTDMTSKSRNTTLSGVEDIKSQEMSVARKEVKTIKEGLGDDTLRKLRNDRDLLLAFGGSDGLEKVLNQKVYDLSRPKGLTDEVLKQLGYENFYHYLVEVAAAYY